MKKNLPLLTGTQLFHSIEESQLEAMLQCLGSEICTYKKGEFVYRQGDPITDIAILLEGKLHIQREDCWGNRNIVIAVMPGEMFGGSYTSPRSGPMINNVVAIEDSAVIFLNMERVLTTCSPACPFHMLVIRNLVYAVAEKNRLLFQKLGHLSSRSTREKLMSYLSNQFNRQNSTIITIPFNRHQLADYLSVDRSAMSNELSKMRDEGLIHFEKNQFTLIQHSADTTESAL